MSLHNIINYLIIKSEERKIQFHQIAILTAAMCNYKYSHLMWPLFAATADTSDRPPSEH